MGRASVATGLSSAEPSETWIPVSPESKATALCRFRVGTLYSQPPRVRNIRQFPLSLAGPSSVECLATFAVGLYITIFFYGAGALSEGSPGPCPRSVGFSRGSRIALWLRILSGRAALLQQVERFQYLSTLPTLLVQGIGIEHLFLPLTQVC